MAAVVAFKEQLIMIDTGYAKQPALQDQLRLLKFDPKNFDMVINTHVHPDHVGNNRLFTNARIIVSKTDYDFAKRYSHAMYESDDPVKTLLQFYPEYPQRRADVHGPYSQKLVQRYWQDDGIGDREQIEWIEDQPELPPFIQPVHTPGHTPGHYAVIIKGDENQYICSGDAMPSRLFWKRTLQELAPRYSNDLFMKSKDYIESLDGIIMGGHDKPFETGTKRYVEGQKINL